MIEFIDRVWRSEKDKQSTSDSEWVEEEGVDVDSSEEDDSGSEMSFFGDSCKDNFSDNNHYENLDIAKIFKDVD